MIPINIIVFVISIILYNCNFNLQITSVISITIMTILSVFIWYRHGKDNSVIDTINFKPPKGYSPLEVGYIDNKDRVVKHKNVVAVFIKLVNKGYIEIVDSKEDPKNFVYRKGKSYNGYNYYEYFILRMLFEDYNELPTNLLDKKLSNIVARLKRRIERRGLRNLKVYKEKSFLYNNLIIIFIIITLSLVIIMPYVKYSVDEDIYSVKEYQAYNQYFEPVDNDAPDAKYFYEIDRSLDSYENTEWELKVLVGLFIIMDVFIISLVYFLKFKNSRNRFISLLVTFISAYVFFGYCKATYIVDYINEYLVKQYNIVSIYAIICTIIMIFIYKIMPARNSKFDDVLGQINGFKNFIKYAEKEEIEAIIKDNPLYFQESIPYIYSLDLSKDIIDKIDNKLFEDLKNTLDYKMYKYFSEEEGKII